MAELPKGKATHLAGDGVPRRRQGATMPSRFWTFFSPSSNPTVGGHPALEERRTKFWTNMRKRPLRQLGQYGLHARFISSQSFLKYQRNCSFLKPYRKHHARPCVFVTYDLTFTFFPFRSVEKQDGPRRLRWAEAHNEITAKYRGRFSTLCDNTRDCGQNVKVLHHDERQQNDDQTDS